MNVKRLTIINLFVSLFAWILFLFNQLCNLRYLGLWQAWNLSGYAFVFLVGPLSAIFSVICALISFDQLDTSRKIDKYLITNTIFTVITVFLLIGSFVFPNTWTWM